MDLKKAFDCLPYACWRNQNAHPWLAETAYEAMFDYLKDRKQLMKILNHRNSWKELTKGVSKCSISGPSIFNNLIHDLR